MRRSKLTLFLLSLLSVATIALDTRAQAVYGSIAGTVTDSKGQWFQMPLSQSEALIETPSILFKRMIRESTLKDRLLPGVYEVKVEKTGYKQAVTGGCYCQP